MRNFAARSRIQFNSIYTLRSVEGGLVGHGAVGVWFNLDDEIGAKLLFLKGEPESSTRNREIRRQPSHVARRSQLTSC